jgi:hypothetical protein
MHHIPEACRVHTNPPRRLPADRGGRTATSCGPDRVDASRRAAGREGPPDPGVGRRHLRWSATLAALLSFAPGCTDRPETERRLVPFLNENGRISYYFEDEIPETAPPPGPVAARQPQYFAVSGRGDDQAYREMVEYRRKQQDRMSQELQERLSAQSQQDGMLRYQRELARLEQQASRERDSQQFHQRREQEARDQAAWRQQQLDEQSRWLKQQQRP